MKSNILPIVPLRFMIYFWALKCSALTNLFIIFRPSFGKILFMGVSCEDIYLPTHTQSTDYPHRAAVHWAELANIFSRRCVQRMNEDEDDDDLAL